LGTVEDGVRWGSHREYGGAELVFEIQTEKNREISRKKNEKKPRKPRKNQKNKKKNEKNF
jgi:hypothetical protein